MKFPRNGEEYNSWSELPAQNPDSGDETELLKEGPDLGEPSGQSNLSEFGDINVEEEREPVHPEIRERMMEFDVEECMDRMMDTNLRILVEDIQTEIEEEYRENGNMLVYGVVDGELEPVVVKPKGDPLAYAEQDWYDGFSSRMMPLDAYLDASDTDIAAYMASMRDEMPEGLRNYSLGVLGDLRNEFSEADTQYLEGQYLLPGTMDLDQEEE